MLRDDWHSSELTGACPLHAPVRQECLCLSVSYLCCTNHTLIKPSFVFCLLPLSPVSLPHFISLHPILCVWVEGGDSVQARLLLRRLQHHLSQQRQGSHSWQRAHYWWYSHHWHNGKTTIAVMCLHSELMLITLILWNGESVCNFSPCSCTLWVTLTSVSCPFFFPDRAGWMLPGAFPRRALASFCSKPLCVVPVQGAGKLHVWLLCGSVSH